MLEGGCVVFVNVHSNLRHSRKDFYVCTTLKIQPIALYLCLKSLQPFEFPLDRSRRDADEKVYICGHLGWMIYNSYCNWEKIQIHLLTVITQKDAVGPILHSFEVESVGQKGSLCIQGVTTFIFASSNGDVLLSLVHKGCSATQWFKLCT